MERRPKVYLLEIDLVGTLIQEQAENGHCLYGLYKT